MEMHEHQETKRPRVGDTVKIIDGPHIDRRAIIKKALWDDRAGEMRFVVEEQLTFCQMVLKPSSIRSLA